MLCRLEDKLAAQAEHVHFVPLTEPAVLIGGKTGHVVSVLCQRMRVGGREQSRPIPVEGSIYTMDADLVVLAPELGPDPFMAEAAQGMEVDSEGWIVTDKETGQTTRDGVFAAGDNTGDLHLAVMAIAEGRKVASSIHEYLT